MPVTHLRSSPRLFQFDSICLVDSRVEPFIDSMEGNYKKIRINNHYQVDLRIFLCVQSLRLFTTPLSPGTPVLSFCQVRCPLLGGVEQYLWRHLFLLKYVQFDGMCSQKFITN